MNKISLVHLVFVMMIWPVLSFSQELNNVSIFGYVTDTATGERIRGVLVEAIDEADSTHRSSALSDIDGRYVIDLITDVKAIPGEGIPSEFRLEQNYPNPFNPTTLICFHIPQPAEVHLDIYNILGQRIKILVDEFLPAGRHSVIWDATDRNGNGVSAGLYFYQLRAEDITCTRKMILVDGSAKGIYKIPRSDPQPENRDLFLSKTNIPTITIRASGARVQPFEQKHVAVSSELFRFDIGVDVVRSVLNRDLIIISEPGAEGKVYVSGMAGAVTDTILGTEKISVANLQTQETVSMRVDYDGSFSLMSTIASVDDQLDITLSSSEQQVGESEIFSVEPNKAPKVLEARPPNGDKDIIVDAVIFIYFSEPMDAKSVTPVSITLTSDEGDVAGSLGLLNNNTDVSFKPVQSLTPL